MQRRKNVKYCLTRDLITFGRLKTPKLYFKFDILKCLRITLLVNGDIPSQCFTK